MPMLWAFKRPTHSKAAMEASTAEPFLFKMSLYRQQSGHVISQSVTCGKVKAGLEYERLLTSPLLNTFQHQQPQQPLNRSGPRGEACFSSPNPWTPQGTDSLQPPEGPPDQQSGTSQPFSCLGKSAHLTVRSFSSDTSALSSIHQLSELQVEPLHGLRCGEKRTLDFFKEGRAENSLTFQRKMEK